MTTSLRTKIFVIIIILGMFVFAELAARAYFFVKKSFLKEERRISKTIGWENKEFISKEYSLPGYSSRPIHYSTQQYGFRVFGNPKSQKVKILVVGDSYTDAHTVSDGEEYYAQLTIRNGDIEVFAYGCGGYSTLQEFFIMDKYLDIIKPDLIVWQFHSNDLINNSYKLESACPEDNNHMRRPYYERGRIHMRYPQEDRGIFYNMAQHSYLLKLLNINIDFLSLSDGDKCFDRMTPEHAEMKEAIRTTYSILNIAQKRAGPIPIVAFSADDHLWINSIFANLCQQNDIRYLGIIPQILKEAESRGKIVNGLADSHWNRLGHYLIGRTIYDYLAVNGFLKKIQQNNN